jgi:hypothetical protein
MHGRRVLTMAAVVALGALAVGGCSQSPRAAVADQVLVVHTGSTGPYRGASPGAMAQAVNALSCAVYQLDPANQGGGYREIHLRVPALDATSAAATIKSMKGVAPSAVTIQPLESFAASPSAQGGVAGPRPC